MIKVGKEYYYNNKGQMVLTAAYLKKRGFCCHNGCLHCPYAKKKDIKEKR